MPNAQIIDVSHAIKPHNILQAAYILKNAAQYFPKGTIHIISIDTSFELHKQILIVQYNSHFYIGADNGIFSLLFDEQPQQVLQVKNELINVNDLSLDKNLFVTLALKLTKNEDINNFTNPSEIKNIKQNISPVVEENLIRGSIVFIDGYGNAISNISKNLFDLKSTDKNHFNIFYRRKEKISYISKNYSDVKHGYELALFNEAGLLEISMNTGKAGQLLGLIEGSQIIIEFYD
jgi:hypothetical protein